MWASISHMATVSGQVLAQVWTFLVSVISSARLSITFILSPTGSKVKATISFPLTSRLAVSLTIPLEYALCLLYWALDWYTSLSNDTQ